MADLDRLVDSIDVDAALDQVVERHRRDAGRNRNQRAAVAVACAAMLVALTWLVVRDPDAERSLDVADQSAPASTAVEEPPVIEVPTEEPTPPACSATAAQIDAARLAVESSPLMASMDRSAPRSIGELLPAGQVVALGTVIAARDNQSDVPPEAGWPTEAETGIRLVQSGVVLTVSTPGGDVEVPITLAMGGSTAVEAMGGVRTGELLDLEGACVIVRYPAADVEPSNWRPAILAVAAYSTAAPMALDTINDGVVAGYASPDELLTALRSGP